MKNFCSYCGQSTAKVKTGRFDENTGEPLYKNACQNKSCTDRYCIDNFGGHEYRLKWWRMGTEVCKRCKYKFVGCYD